MSLGAGQCSTQRAPGLGLKACASCLRQQQAPPVAPAALGPARRVGGPHRQLQQQQQQQRPSRPGHACAAVPLPEAVTASLFAGSTLYTAALAALMVVAPRWQRTQQLMRRASVLLPLAAAYGFLLLCSWESDTFSLILPGSWEEGFKGGFNPQFFPELTGIMALFSRLVTAASLWVHLLAINLFAARSAYLEGLELGVPTWHSILLCMALSPLGLLSHFITKRLWKRAGTAAH